MDKDEKIRTLYEALAAILNLLESEDQNINTSRITGGGGLGVEWVEETDRWIFWERCSG